MARTAFISGPLNISEDRFRQLYIPAIDKAIADNDSFVIGDAIGVDKIALDYLISRGVDKSRITIYQRKRKQKVVYENINTLEFKSDKEKDVAMTKNSHYDIAFPEPIEDLIARIGDAYDPSRISGTQQNINRRKEL